MQYNKLVRDRVPGVIERDGNIPITHIADEDEYKAALFRKLQEEVDAFIENQSNEELADILEVIRAICDLKDITFSEIEMLREEKAMKKGAFKLRIMLDRTE